MSYWKILKETALEFWNDDPWTWSASIAFYVIFSLPAIIIITMSVAGSLYDDAAVRQSLLDQAGRLLGPESAGTIQSILANAGAYGGSLAAELAGIAILLFSATTVIVTLQHTLNTLWGIRLRPDTNLFKYVVDRLLSLAMVIGMGFLLLVSLLLDTFLALFRELVVEWLSGASWILLSGVNQALSLGVIALIFAVTFRVLPDAEVAWRDVWTGAFLTALLFSAGKFLIGFYLGNSVFGSIYGAAGSLVVMLVWIYYSAVIVLVGAEFTYVYARARGRPIRPDSKAMRFPKPSEREPDDPVW
ncbi:MAG: YihY/virulence factor BrkB family protein [Balneolaceae bacterium]|nr:YihY/virulence factor BrkB family protein [Balneolaceae bacterium]